MMWSISNVIVLPFLIVVSIPLVLSASATIVLAVGALFLRVLVVYVELSFALMKSYFLITPASQGSPALVLSGTASPVSPGSKHRIRDVDSDSVHVQDRHRRTPSREAFLSLVSDDYERDFEGVGGWRPLPVLPHNRKRTTLSPSPSSASLDEEETEDRAWLSINGRLELPSQSFPLTLSGVGSETERHPRHHRRSVTTSSLPFGYPAESDLMHLASSWQFASSDSGFGPENLVMTGGLRPQPLFTTSTDSRSRDGQVASPRRRSMSMADRPLMNIGRIMAHYPAGQGFIRRRRSSSPSGSSPRIKVTSPSGSGSSS